MKIDAPAPNTGPGIAGYTENVAQGKVARHYAVKKAERESDRVGAKEFAQMSQANMRDRDKGMYIDVQA